MIPDITFIKPNETFPESMSITEDGLVAIGGNLSSDMLLQAYSNGIFPWFNSDDDYIMWWSPSPRLVLFPNELKVSKSLKRTIKKDKFKIRFNTNFEEVINNCAKINRIGQEATWITNEMKKAYINLYNEGFVISAESYIDEKLVGGLYGVVIGRVFFGESMFAKTSDASKVAFYYLVQYLKQNNFEFIDCQMTTNHLVSLGAREIERDEFHILLDKGLS
jgi:leucyl/phenylalanyl-tRNA--protein transferase